jgi:hypothetical protein
MAADQRELYISAASDRGYPSPGGAGGLDNLPAEGTLELAALRRQLLLHMPGAVMRALPLVQPVQIPHQVEDGRTGAGRAGRLDCFDPARRRGKRLV